MSKTIHFIEIQIKQFVESMRPPADIRDKLDIGYQFENNTLELYEIRPRWDDPKEIIHSSIAKTRFIKSREIWKIYWKRASGKWESYEPKPEVKRISDFFKVITEDTYGCFFG